VRFLRFFWETRRKNFSLGWSEKIFFQYQTTFQKKGLWGVVYILAKKKGGFPKNALGGVTPSF